MLPEVGHFFLILALTLAVLLTVAPMLGVYGGFARLLHSARPLALLTTLFVALAYLVLTVLFVNNDFSVAIVASHSNLSLPLIYKISAVWGGHEGSLLLWVLILALWTTAVALFSKQLPDDLVAQVLSVLGVVLIGFLLFSLLTSNPFLRNLPQIPMNGQDLNPLLQDVGMAIHPPMLYFGYVGFAVAFAFAIAALLRGDLDPAWVRWTRPWTTAAWSFLTLGIALGSWWAYYELGWGGWWFWDPVENASFMPWLMGTALIHSLAVTEKRGHFKSWSLLLAIFTFSLSLLGTFLVRSGVLTSVHAFAADPSRGLFILGFLVLIVGGSLTLFAFRAPKPSTSSGFSFFSREYFLLINNLLLVVATLTVLVGTLFPLIADFFGLGKYSVGPPYFNKLFVPLMLLLIVFLGIGPLLNWKRSQKRHWQTIIFIVLPLGALISAVGVLLFAYKLSLPALVAAGMAGWLVSSMLYDVYYKLRHQVFSFKSLTKLPVGFYVMQLAHIGLIVTAVGIAIVSYYDNKQDVKLSVGESVEISGYTFELEGLKAIRGPNYRADQGVVRVSQDDKLIAILKPEKRFYDSQRGNVMTEAAIDATLGRDLFVAMGEPLGEGAWALRIQYKPFLRFIWLGALIMALAGFLSIFDKRYRRHGTNA